MAWYSILPAELERWIVRCFLFLGLVTILPWLTLLFFDMALYTWRLVTYYLPGVGGRARGQQRPRAPSLNELPDRFGLSASGNASAGADTADGETGGERELDEKENVDGGGVSGSNRGGIAGGGLKRRGGQSTL